MSADRIIIIIIIINRVMGLYIFIYNFICTGHRFVDVEQEDF